MAAVSGRASPPTASPRSIVPSTAANPGNDRQPVWPKAQGWYTVKRQAMAVDDAATTGVYFATTSGEVWASRDEGRTWKCIAAHLPHIYAIEAA